MSIFDYARIKIHKEYSSRYDYSFDQIKKLENYDLDYIDWYEDEATKGFKNAIFCPFKAFWKVQTDNEKLFIGCSMAVIVFVFYACLIWIDNTPLNIIILNVSEIFFYCTVMLGIVWMYRIIRKRFIKRKVFYIVWVLFLVFSTPNFPILFDYETTQIGDFYEAREYTEKYYVIFSREPQSNKDRKQYMLPAQIQRRYDYEGATDEGREIYELNYHINYLYFSNGYLSFDYDGDYDDSSRSSVMIGQESSVEDYHGNTYYITLTDKKVKK